MTTERPILFSAPMVRAILAGKKTETRRAVKPQPDGLFIPWKRFCPYGEIGDHLWVRETFCRTGAGVTIYRADSKTDQPYWTLLKWKPSIFMPRWASRITLGIVDIKVERLQRITRAGIEVEGFASMEDFIELWNMIHKKDGMTFDKNCWVWVIKFVTINR
jgi:hypothetical protein